MVSETVTDIQNTFAESDSLETTGDSMEGSRVQRIQDWLATQWDRCTDDAFAQGFATGCPVPGASVDDYRQRVIEVAGISVLIGIRIRGGGGKEAEPWPFVDLVASDAPIAPDLGIQVVDAALEALAMFAPRALRLRGAANWTPWPGVRAEVDQWFLAGTVNRMASIASSGESSDDASVAAAISLSPVREAAQGAAFVDEVFAAWGERRAWFAERVLRIDASGLRACIDARCAWWIHEGEEQAGLLALLPDSDREWHGWCVHEELVLPAFAGRGIAARAQRLAAREIAQSLIAPQAQSSDRSVMDLVYGTIDAANQPSVRTAERAGRAKVGAYWWVFPPSR